MAFHVVACQQFSTVLDLSPWVYVKFLLSGAKEHESLDISMSGSNNLSYRNK